MNSVSPIQQNFLAETTPATKAKAFIKRANNIENAVFKSIKNVAIVSLCTSPLIVPLAFLGVYAALGSLIGFGFKIARQIAEKRFGSPVSPTTSLMKMLDYQQTQLETNAMRGWLSPNMAAFISENRGKIQQSKQEFLSSLDTIQKRYQEMNENSQLVYSEEKKVVEKEISEKTAQWSAADPEQRSHIGEEIFQLNVDLKTLAKKRDSIFEKNKQEELQEIDEAHEIFSQTFCVLENSFKQLQKAFIYEKIHAKALKKISSGGKDSLETIIEKYTAKYTQKIGNENTVTELSNAHFKMRKEEALKNEIAALEEKSKNGDTKAMIALAKLCIRIRDGKYDDTIARDPDDRWYWGEKAISLLVKAGKKQDSEALLILGDLNYCPRKWTDESNCYWGLQYIIHTFNAYIPFDGTTFLPIDYAKKYYQQAADLGSKEAKKQLAKLEPKGPDYNDKKDKKRASKGDKDVLFRLGLLENDRQKIMFAAQLGHVEAMQNIACHHAEQNEWEKALEWLLKAQTLGNDSLNGVLMFMYKKGVGTSVDLDKAATFQTEEAIPLNWANLLLRLP